MGIWDYINSGKETVKQYTPDLVTPVKNVCNASYDYSTTAVKKIDDIVQKLSQYFYMPDEEERTEIVNFSKKLVKNASVYAVKDAVNDIPGVRAFSKILSETVREMENESKKNQDSSCGKDSIDNSSMDTVGTGPPGSLENKIASAGGGAVSKMCSETVREMENESKKNQDTSCVKHIIDNSSMDTVGGRAVSKIYSKTVREMEIEFKKNQDMSCDKEIIGNSCKPPGLLDGAEILESKELKLGSENRAQVDSFTHQTPEDVLRVFMMKEFMGARFLDNLLVPDH